MMFMILVFSIVGIIVYLYVICIGLEWGRAASQLLIIIIIIKRRSGINPIPPTFIDRD